VVLVALLNFNHTVSNNIFHRSLEFELTKTLRAVEMLFLTTFNAFSFTALLLFSVTNAAPVSVFQYDPNLQTRGNSHSVAHQLTTCPDAERLIQLLRPHLPDLHNKALFWTDVGLPVAEKFALERGKLQLRDIFHADVRGELQRVCNRGDGIQHDFMVMSEAMAILASGEAWVLKDSPLSSGPQDIFWEKELTTMRNRRRVTQLWRVDRSGRKVERINI